MTEKFITGHASDYEKFSKWVETVSSFPRLEYFRRIFCNVLSNEVEKGELPNNLTLVGNLAKCICSKNAVD